MAIPATVDELSSTVCGSRIGKQIRPTYVRTIKLLLDPHLGDKRNGFVKMTILATV
jgi:hypothetical protein